jgi:hypothetical protein
MLYQFCYLRAVCTAEKWLVVMPNSAFFVTQCLYSEAITNRSVQVEAVKIQVFRDTRLVLLCNQFPVFQRWCQQNVGNYSSNNTASHLTDGHNNTVISSNLAEHFSVSVSIPQLHQETNKFLVPSYIFTFNFT